MDDSAPKKLVKNLQKCAPSKTDVFVVVCKETYPKMIKRWSRKIATYVKRITPQNKRERKEKWGIDLFSTFLLILGDMYL